MKIKLTKEEAGALRNSCKKDKNNVVTFISPNDVSDALIGYVDKYFLDPLHDIIEDEANLECCVIDWKSNVYAKRMKNLFERSDLYQFETQVRSGRNVHSVVKSNYSEMDQECEDEINKQFYADLIMGKEQIFRSISPLRYSKCRVVLWHNELEISRLPEELPVRCLFYNDEGNEKRKNVVRFYDRVDVELQPLEFAIYKFFFEKKNIEIDSFKKWSELCDVYKRSERTKLKTLDWLDNKEKRQKNLGIQIDKINSKLRDRKVPVCYMIEKEYEKNTLRSYTFGFWKAF